MGTWVCMGFDNKKGVNWAGENDQIMRPERIESIPNHLLFTRRSSVR